MTAFGSLPLPRLRALGVAGLAAAALSAGCGDFEFGMPAGSRPVQIPSANAPALDLERVDMSALTVERVRVHPLTRWEDVEESPRLLVHVELRDRYGHAIKGFGEMRIELSGRGDEGDAVWSVDLIDPDTNARYYDDLISRTYQVSISGLPDWVKSWLAEAEPDDWMRITAYFRTLDTEGRERVLQDDLRIPP